MTRHICWGPHKLLVMMRAATIHGNCHLSLYLYTESMRSSKPFCPNFKLLM